MNTFLFDWAQSIAQPTPTGARRPIFKSPTGTLAELSIHSTTLHPGQKAHEPHAHPEEEMIIVREGTLEALIGGTTHALPAGSVLIIAPNDFHGVTNVGNIPATYYVIKWFPYPST